MVENKEVQHHFLLHCVFWQRRPLAGLRNCPGSRFTISVSKTDTEYSIEV